MPVGHVGHYLRKGFHSSIVRASPGGALTSASVSHLPYWKVCAERPVRVKALEHLTRCQFSTECGVSCL